MEVVETPRFNKKEYNKAHLEQRNSATQLDNTQPT